MKVLLIPALVLLIVVSAFLFSACEYGADEGAADCNMDNGPCAGAVGETGMTAVLDITPRPVRTMRRLSFRINLKEGTTPVTDEDVTVELSMPGMYMPENRVRLIHTGEGGYEGEGVIVRCPAGKRLRKTRAVLGRASADSGTPQAASFIFRVED